MNEPQRHIYEFGGFRLCAAKRLLLNGVGEIVPLMPKAFDTLLYLVEHSGKVIEKDELMREIWADTIVEENNLTQNISILRRVFGEKPGEHRFIVTVPGHGYKFVAEVRDLPEEDSAPDDGLTPSGLQTANDKFQIENQSEIGNRKSEIIKNQKPKAEAQRAGRFWLVAVFSIFAIGAVGFYLWRENVKNATATNAPVKTVAVLPFKPLVSENRNEVLELGMADTLIAKLGGEELAVRPLGSVRKYASPEQDSIAAGRELGVEAILDGTIQTWGDRVRISTRLVRTSDGRQLWAGQFDEKLTDIFAVQDSISERVAAALKIRLGNAEKNRQTENVEAYELYMKGRYHVLKLKPSETSKAISYFQQAIAVDPSYARAYLGLANSYRSLALAGEMTPNEFLPQAKAAANKAIEIDDTLAEAHAELCYIVFRYDWNWSEAETRCQRALELDPNDAEAHHA
ncbi:MAG: winged helix-turn-helix domain-containing protein, partial [Acidobacteriota bacterium]|nr:winged helix-turn-helix domain-containing protein [Acidobacteriota bacterium]